MEKPEFVSRMFILTTPERLWHALIDPAFTRRYWGVSFASDWNVGSTITVTFEKSGAVSADPAQVILEADPYRRLAYTWHTFTPEWAATYGFDEEYLAEVSSEARSKVTFDTEQVGPVAKLTVIHDGFDAGSTMLASITQGWPEILSGLKTLLESGDDCAW